MYFNKIFTILNEVVTKLLLINNRKISILEKIYIKIKNKILLRIYILIYCSKKFD